MNKAVTYKKRVTTVTIVAIAVICSWSMAGHIVWNIARQACYQYVHHLKQERSFRDTITLHIDTYNNRDMVVWVKKNEIRYDGRMFDIKTIHLSGKYIMLVGHYDDFEHELYKTLHQLFDDENNLPSQQENNSWYALTAILPGCDTSKTYINLPGLPRFNKWKNNFHYCICIPPLQYPPDCIV